MNWFITCVTSANYVVLINGSPTSSFNSSRGLRQGCPLSPLLSLLIVEGLSLLINEAKILGKIHGVSFSSTLVITHLLFMDDVVLFCRRTLEEWCYFRDILDIFTAASGMVISVDNSSFFV